jgi:tRNA-(ms[2]io[6]A)-hydroxylase
LPPPVADLYAGLQASEARHFELYLKLAEAHAKAHPESTRERSWQSRLQELAEIEAQLIVTPDPEFRFHSGLPDLQG